NGTAGGITFMGRAWSEPTLTNLAYAFEQATKAPTEHRSTLPRGRNVDAAPAAPPCLPHRCFWQNSAAHPMAEVTNCRGSQLAVARCLALQSTTWGAKHISLIRALCQATRPFIGEPVVAGGIADSSTRDGGDRLRGHCSETVPVEPGDAS